MFISLKKKQWVGINFTLPYLLIANRLILIRFPSIMLLFSTPLSDQKFLLRTPILIAFTSVSPYFTLITLTAAVAKAPTYSERTVNGTRYYSKAPIQKTKKAKNLAWSRRVGRSQSQDFRHQALDPSEVQTVTILDVFFPLNSIRLRKGHLSYLFLINWSFVTLAKIVISHIPQILPWYIVLGYKTSILVYCAEKR